MVGGPICDKLSAKDFDILASSTTPTLKPVQGGIRLVRNKSRSPPPPTRYSRRTAAHRASERPPIVSRRLRRTVNDRAIEVAAEDIQALPATRADLRALFERGVHTVFTTLSEDTQAALAWAPYIEQHVDDVLDINKKILCNNNLTGLHKVDHKIRHVLKSRSAVVKPIIKQVEDTVVGLHNGESIVLKLPHALSRLIAHGVAQFHSLSHRSCGVGADRVLVIRGKGDGGQGGARLVDVVG